MNKELTFIDILSIASFVIALENLDLNISQEDLTGQTHELSEDLHKAIQDIHEHLAVQDAKLNAILNRMEEL